MVSETACHVFPLMIDYIHLWLTLAISCHANFHTRRKELLYALNVTCEKLWLEPRVFRWPCEHSTTDRATEPPGHLTNNFSPEPYGYTLPGHFKFAHEFPVGKSTNLIVSECSRLNPLQEHWHLFHIVDYHIIFFILLTTGPLFTKLFRLRSRSGSS